MLGAGQGAFVAAAAVVAGLPLIASASERHRFQGRFPAAFFLRLGGHKP